MSQSNIKTLQNINFSLGYFGKDITKKFALISLICYVTYKAQQKNSTITHSKVIKSLIKQANLKLPKYLIEELCFGLTKLCEDFSYGCTEFPTFEIQSNKIVDTIKEILREYSPF